MKLLHTGDLHLGRTLGEFDLASDQKYILEQILQIAEREAADAILVAGDVYDRAVPSEAATRLLDWFLRALAERGIPAFLISGNHDSDDRLNYGSGLFEANRIYISAGFDGTLHHQTLTDLHGETDIWLLPFVKASRVRHFFPEEKIETYEDAVRTILAHADIDWKKRNVLVAHQFVTAGGTEPEMSGSERTPAQSVGLVEKIGCGCFADFDYTALGHIHSAQRVGREEIRYAGSVLKYSVSEAAGCKSVTLVTLGGKGETEIEQIPLRPMRDLRRIRGPLEKLLAKENICATEDFIYAILTDEDPAGDVMGIFQQVYPNTVAVHYDNSHTREIENADLPPMGENRSFPELIRDFYLQMYGCEISDEEMKVMKQAAMEAGVIDEAD